MKLQKIDRENRERINDFIIRQWFTLQMVVHGESIDLGEAEGWHGNPDEVLDAMEQVDFRPIEISLDGVGSFGELFWAGLADNPQLTGYVKRLRRELAEQGIPFDKKRFSPHITLIRKYSCRGGREIPVSDPPKGSMVATRVSLMRSERGKNGMIYTEIGSIS